MSRSLLSSSLTVLFLLAAATTTALQFPLKHYRVSFEAQTKPGDIVGQVAALSDIRDANITYRLDSNPYVDIDGESGELQWRNTSIPSVNGIIKNYTVTARADAGEETTTQVQLVLTTDVCSCSGMSMRDISVSRAENLSPQKLVFIRSKGCSERNGYQLLGGDGRLTIVDNWLVISELDYEESRTVVGQLICKERGQEVNINVNVINQADQAPYALIKGLHNSFVQYDRLVDANHHGSFLKDKMTLSVMFDPVGSTKKWKVKKPNDYHDQLIMSLLQTRKQGTRAFGYVTVTAANTTRITSSTEIDVVFTDLNMDIRGVGNETLNTVIFKFNLTYTDVDALQNLLLPDKYEVTIVKNAPVYTQIMQVLNETSKFLIFELSTYFGSESCKGALDVTPHQGVIYVNNTEQLSQCGNNTIIFNVTVSQKNSGSRSTLVYLNLEAADELVTNTTKLVSCADYKYVDDCESSSGIGSFRCQWKVVLLPDNSNFSTCVSSDTCADRECSEYENLDKAICPQDCLDNQAWYNVVTNKLCRKGSVGICHSGVCYCTNNVKYCQCVPEDLLDVDVYWATTDDNRFNSSGVRSKGSTETDDATVGCGVECMVPIAIALAILIVIIVVVVLWHRLKNRKLAANINDWRVTGNNLNLHFTSCPDYEGSTPSTIISAFSDWPQAHPYLNTGTMEIYDEKWELSRDHLLIGDYIGEGEFGRVLKAQYRKCLLSDWLPAAVKMLKDGASRVEFGDLLSEYTLLKEVDHPNVIKLIGAATLNGPFHLVVEYCEHGSLKNYLRRIRTEEPAYINGATRFYADHANQLMDFSGQISKGMQYLSEIKLVHRDLATRNILIATDNVIKISDFGMTKDIYEEDAYKKKGQGRIPVKWMAPESLYHQIYTTKSDVWSFGIVLWEISTLGATPYPGIPAERMYNLLQEGYRMDRPETCSTALYTLMRKCWDYDPATRPSFKELKYSLEKMVESGEVNLDLKMAAQNQRVCHGSTSISTGSEDDSELHPLTVSFLPSSESKFVADYLVSTDDQVTCNEKSPLRYTTLEYADDDQ